MATASIHDQELETSEEKYVRIQSRENTSSYTPKPEGTLSQVSAVSVTGVQMLT